MDLKMLESPWADLIARCAGLTVGVFLIIAAPVPESARAGAIVIVLAYAFFTVRFIRRTWPGVRGVDR